MMQILATFMMVISSVQSGPNAERKCVSEQAYSSVGAQYTPDSANTQFRILLHDYTWKPDGDLLLDLRGPSAPILMVKLSRIEDVSIMDSPSQRTASLVKEHKVTSYVLPLTIEEYGGLMEAYTDLIENPEPVCFGYCSHCVGVRIDSAVFDPSHTREEFDIRNASDEDKKFIRAVLRVAKQNISETKSGFLDGYEKMLDLPRLH